MVLLEKWYGDYVSGGVAHVHYLANLRMDPMTLGHVGAISSDGQSSGRFVLRPVSPPSAVGGRVVWPLERGGTVAWSGAQARPIRLFAGIKGEIAWNPWVLNGLASGERFQNAAGYVECLTMDFGPWHLGLQALRWGRFCGARESLVWIEWQGATSLRLLLLNGRPIGLDRVDGDGVRSLQGHELRFESPRKFVAGPLVQTAFGALPGAVALRAVRFFRGVQERWLCDAQLKLPAGRSDSGCALFEELRWP